MIRKLKLLTDKEWAIFEPLVVQGGPLRGRPPRDHRRTLDAVFWVARTGAPWRDLPTELGNWNSARRSASSGDGRHRACGTCSCRPSPTLAATLTPCR